MPKKNRETLARYFREGELPREDHFRDLIDSALIKFDDGFDKTVLNGWEIRLIGDHDRLISFLRDNAVKQAAWSISYDKHGDRLMFVKPAADGEARSVVVFDPRGRVGVNTREPQWELEVAGNIAADGRIGGNPYRERQKSVPADGGWHPITDELEGCHAFEVMAGVGKKDSGMYALMQALAINTFNPKGPLFNFLRRKNRIRYTQAFYLSRGHKIQLRWEGAGSNSYVLSMRTGCNYGNNSLGKPIVIRYYLTRLWFDSHMQASWDDDSATGDDESAEET
jgi:hypothetical protein